MSIKTDNDGPGDELPLLTPKQTAFVDALLRGKTASDAYREAYNCESMSQGAIWVEASRLRRSPKISLWLRHYQRIGADAARMTMKSHLAELARARELAINVLPRGRADCPRERKPSPQWTFASRA